MKIVSAKATWLYFDIVKLKKYRFTPTTHAAITFDKTNFICVHISFKTTWAII